MKHPQSHDRVALSALELVVIVGILLVLAALLASGVQRARATAARAECLGRLGQLGQAFHQFHHIHGRFPAGVRVKDRTDPYLYMSWNTQLLPFLEQESLWKATEAAFRQSPNFQTNPPHIGLAKPMPAFSCPSDPRAHMVQTPPDSIPRALTSFLGLEGTRSFFQDGVLYADSAIRFADITDGASHTLLVGERPASADLLMGWWYGGAGQDHDGEGDSVLGTRTKNNLSYGPNCPVGPYNFGHGTLTNQCNAFHFWSLHPGGANFLFAGGEVKFLSYSADAILPALGTRAGGEAVSLPD